MRMLQGSHAIAGSDALTIDGRIVHIRPVTEGDAVALTALYGRGSPASLRIRFLVPSPSAIAAVEVVSRRGLPPARRDLEG
jgi:hypothetical protein